MISLALDVRREYNLDALQSAGVGTPSETVQFPVFGSFIRGVTIDNGSNCVVGIFLDRDPGGVPSFLVPAGTFKTQPILAQRVGISVQKPTGDIARGTIYALFGQEQLSASSGVSAGPNVMGIWDSSQWDTGTKFG